MTRRRPSRREKAAKTRRLNQKKAFRASQPVRYQERPEPDIIWTKDKRMICGDTPLGRELYNALIDFMWLRDKGFCCICNRPIWVYEQRTFEHTDKRGGGHRNDQPEYWKPNGEFVKNGVAHSECNLSLGSVRLRASDGDEQGGKENR